MAEFEKEDYKFPDEVEKVEIKGKEVNFDLENDEKPDFEVEVEDDVPPKDRNRTPMPKEIVEDLDRDELDQYDEEVKQRLVQMRKVYHDERREKEQALREQREAIEATNRLLAENKRIKEMLATGEKEYVSAVKNSVEMELDKAKREYREAYESGETDRIMDAQQKITEATLKLDRVNNFKLPPLQEEKFEVQREQQYQSVPKPDAKVQAWQERNTWFGQDEEMTAAALGLHEKLKRQGVQIGSDEYYATLDKTIRKRFPENFGEEESFKETPKKTSTVVAPATRSTNAKKVKLSTSQVALAKKLGLTPEQYVREVIKLEN
jgi:hypothetical protein